MYDPEKKLTPEQTEALSKNATDSADYLKELLNEEYPDPEERMKVFEAVTLIGMAFATAHIPPAISQTTAKALSLMARAMDKATKDLPNDIRDLIDDPSSDSADGESKWN